MLPRGIEYSGFPDFLGELGDQTVADLANVFDASRQVGVLHRAKALADRGDLGVNGCFRVDPLAFDAGVRATQAAADPSTSSSRRRAGKRILGRPIGVRLDRGRVLVLSRPS